SERDGRKILQRGAGLQIPERQRVRARHLQFFREWRRVVAELDRRVDDDALVSGSANVEAPLQQSTPSKPAVEGDIDAVVDFLLRSIVRRLRHQIVDETEFRRLDVPQVADLIPTASG